MKIAASILNANFSNLESEIKKIQTCEYIHLDIMDGHFVPNISFGPSISKVVSKISNMPLDVHLMVTDPYNWITKFIYPTTEFITVHYESNNYLEALKFLKENNIKVGISIKPKTTVSEITHLLSIVDLVLVMTVEPGFGGQSFSNDAALKIKELFEHRKDKNLGYLIQVDGGINLETAKIAKEYGTDIIVVGSYLFNSQDTIEKIKELKGI